MPLALLRPELLRRGLELREGLLLVVELLGEPGDGRRGRGRVRARIRARARVGVGVRVRVRKGVRKRARDYGGVGGWEYRRECERRWGSTGVREYGSTGVRPLPSTVALALTLNLNLNLTPIRTLGRTNLFFMITFAPAIFFSTSFILLAAAASSSSAFASWVRRVRRFVGSLVQGCTSARVHECTGARVQGCRGAGWVEWGEVVR